MTVPDPAEVLLFVEDPGAANFVVGLPEALQQRGYSTHLIATGTAVKYLRERGAAVESIEPPAQANLLLDRYRPDLVIVGASENVDTFGFEIVREGRQRRICSIGLVDSSSNSAHRFRGRTDDALAWCPDVVLVPDKTTRTGFIQCGLAPERITVVGHPHWDYVRAAFGRLQQQDRRALRKILFGINDDATVLTFASELSEGLNSTEFKAAANYTLSGNSGCSARTKIAIEEMLIALGPRPRAVHLVLRLHPKDSLESYTAYRADFDYISRDESPLEVIFASDAVVGITSMLLVEAALMRRPTFAILPRATEAVWLPTIAAGITPAASRRQDVITQMDLLLRSSRPCDPGYLDGVFPPGALERLIDAIDAKLPPGKRRPKA